MTKNKKGIIKRWALISLTGAFVIVFILSTGALKYPDRYMADALYQKEKPLNENIVIVGIDSFALETLGPWPWDRKIIADAVNILNSDELNRPAAIGLDIVFTGNIDDASDKSLVEACSSGNVVTAAVAEFDGQVVENNQNFYLDDLNPSLLSLPFPELLEVTRTGHVNTMYDSDGVLRHHIWSLEYNNEEILSFPYQMYKLFCERKGIEPDFTPKVNSDGFWWVDYSTMPGGFTCYSFADILDGYYDPDLLKDAMVFIGPYDTGLSDDFITGMDRAKKMYGVEYMANVTDAMLRGSYKEDAPMGPQLLITFICASVMAYVFFSIKMRWYFPIFTFFVLSSVYLAYVSYQHGIVTHPLWISFASFFVLIMGIAEHYYQANKNRKQINDVFQRYVDPGIINELMKGDMEALGLNGRTLNIAVLFVDIRGFTTLSESLEPEKVVGILDEYLTLTSNCVKKNGGTLDKFIGDCTMAFWGAPLPTKDPIYKAACAAMDMVKGSKIMAEKLMKEYGKDVSFGVGIHYGPAVVGNIGSPERMDYTAIGDTVNTASRLESNAPRGTIYISRVVADSLGDRAKTTSLGATIKLKGKSEGFEVLTLDYLEREGEE